MNVDVCASATQAAQNHTATAQSTKPVVMRYLAATQAQHDWINVAMQCPTQFGEASLRSAQAQYTATLLAKRMKRSYQPLTNNRLDGVESIAVEPDSLAQLALAEDRSGFATEVLAGRYAVKKPAATQMGEASNAVESMAANGATGLLRMSDNHKETASQMMFLANGAKDLRRKVYATQDLLANPDSIVDPTIGVTVSTIAALEMDCARQEAQAVRVTDSTLKDSAQNGHNGNNSADSNRVPSTGTSDAAATTSPSKAKHSNDSSSKTQLALLIASHAYTAFSTGYPCADWALFHN